MKAGVRGNGLQAGKRKTAWTRMFLMNFKSPTPSQISRTNTPRARSCRLVDTLPLSQVFPENRRKHFDLSPPPPPRCLFLTLSWCHLPSRRSYGTEPARTCRTSPFVFAGDGDNFCEAGTVFVQHPAPQHLGPFISRALPQYKYLSTINNYDQVSWVTAHSK